MNRKVYQLEAIGDTAHNWPKTRESTNTEYRPHVQEVLLRFRDS